MEGAPDLLVEILSPSTGQKDLTTERWCCESAGVREYLIVYPEERRAEMLMLGTNGIYQTVSRTEWGERLQILGGRLEISLG